MRNLNNRLILLLEELHHVGWRTLGQQLALHEVHVGGHVGKETVIPLAEVIEPGFAGGRMTEAVLGAFAVAGKEKLALAALRGKAVALHGTKLLLPLAVHHLRQCMGADVAQLVLGEDEVVAGIDVAVVLHYAGMAAGLGQGTHAGLLAHPVGQGGVEELDEIFAHVMPYPLVEEGAEKFTPLRGGDRKIGQGNLLAISRRSQVTPIGMRKDALHDGGKLDVAATYLLEEVVEVERIVGIEVVDHGQGIPLHPVLVEQCDAPHHLLERRHPLLVATVLVVKLLRSIYRDPHEPVVLLKEAAPLVSEQCAVGLQGVVDGAATGILALQLHHPLVEGERPHQRLAAVPGEEHLRHGLRLDVLLDEAFEQLVAHREAPRGFLVSVEVALLKVIAVGAGQVTDRAYGFGHHIQWPCKGGKCRHQYKSIANKQELTKLHADKDKALF